MPASGSRSHVRTRVARPGDLPVVLSLVRQHRADSHAEGVLTGQAPGSAAAAGFRRLLADPEHVVVLAVLPGGTTHSGDTPGDEVVGLAVLGLDPLSAVLGVPQVTVDNLVVHRDHRRRGVGAALLAAAAEHAERCGADHVVAAVGPDAERQRFFARMGFAPLHTRRIVPRENLLRALAGWQRGGVAVPAPRRARPRRPLPARVLPALGRALEV
ncbi:GNAT family N-acetyltransferase [Blastococcus sp. TF02A-26]|uniref:GNAT family N-acetyltransferase n=1 Tax=Blastococcus sp. TF02A-26 TaxID=2250577 RepID=UPI00131495E7|nr:GNAT family N-acetyltransferase [Blastococcus sp. TF02A-26]